MAPARPRPDTLELAEQLSQLFFRMRKLAYASIAPALEDSGTSVVGLQILTCLVMEGPATQRSIAECTSQHPAGVSRELDALEARGLVVRRRDRTDRRKFSVAITAPGRACMRAGRRAAVVALDHTMRGLSRTDRKQLHGLIQKLLRGHEADSVSS